MASPFEPAELALCYTVTLPAREGGLHLCSPGVPQSYPRQVVSSSKFPHLALGTAAVDWVNKDEEAGGPYDLVMKLEDQTVYVEVKTTENDAQGWWSRSQTDIIPLSLGEMEWSGLLCRVSVARLFAKVPFFCSLKTSF